ncbi:Alpha/beta hydrolase fold-1 [Dactylonectria macrodidyma]|uniref:Alpha/beta hydrolase fold-1 n=1 Tax=Dactylonectria macrodidyma TaxID=307937 RepID=A0A9P9FI52_9HYPO|nr:Alpha/beta hydrolase fold-1 [Dactylonectria macrodidyma]
MDDKQKPAVLLVHGAWHRPLHYRTLINDLNAKGFTVLAPPLASSGYDDSVDGKTYHDDVKRIHDVLLPILGAGRTVIGIAHSYGGVPLTVAIQGHTTAERAAKGLKGGIASAIYISPTPVFQTGISMYEAGGRQWPSGWFHDDTRLPLLLDKAKDAFYFDIDQPAKDEALAHVCHQSKAPLEVPIVCTPIELDIPKILIICTEDKIFPKDLQLLTAEKWGATPLEIVSGHSPWLVDSHRHFLVNVIDEEAAKARD